MIVHVAADSIFRYASGAHSLMALRAGRRLWNHDGLPMARAFYCGPKWMRLCDVRKVPIAEANPAAASAHPDGKKILLFTFEDEVRERVLEELRPGVYAMWSDPRERLRA